MLISPENLNVLEQVSYLIAGSADALDEGNYEKWLEMFVPDALYSAITAECLANNGPNLFTDLGVDGRKERVAFWLGMWQVGRARTRHVVGRTLLVENSDEVLRTKTPFIMTRTGDDGDTQLHVSAVYQDDWVPVGDAWKLGWRRVVVDCAVLPASFTDPL